MRDNEYQEELAELVREFADYWRTAILKRSDAELGLGLLAADDDHSSSSNGNNKENPDDDISESRRALYSLLKSRAGEFENFNGKMKFNWKPVKRRKRTANKASSAKK